MYNKTSILEVCTASWTKKGHITILWFKSPYMRASTLEIQTTICRKQQWIKRLSKTTNCNWGPHAPTILPAANCQGTISVTTLTLASLDEKKESHNYCHSWTLHHVKCFCVPFCSGRNTSNNSSPAHQFGSFKRTNCSFELLSNGHTTSFNVLVLCWSRVVWTRQEFYQKWFKIHHLCQRDAHFEGSPSWGYWFLRMWC